jgi:AraC-like DNA-binding protein
MSHASPAVFTYRELRASRAVQHLVLSYWEFAALAEAREPRIHRVFPDGCFGVYYRRNALDQVSSLQLTAPRLGPFDVRMLAGDLYWGLRVSPAAAALVLGRDLSTPSQHLGVDALPLADRERLRQELDRVSTFPEAIAVYETYLGARAIRPDAIDPALAAAVALIERARGQAKIARIAAAVSLSPRQLQRRFLATTGLTPKQFSRTRRLRATALTLGQGQGDETSWVDRAIDLGFADQAHLTRELHAMTGRSPVRFAGDIAAIEHGEIVK